MLVLFAAMRRSDWMNVCMSSKDLELEKVLKKEMLNVIRMCNWLLGTVQQNVKCISMWFHL